MKEIKEQEFKKTVVINSEVYTDPQMYIQTPSYPLDRYEYDKIISGEASSKAKDVLLGTTIALTINIIGKAAASFNNASASYDQWELYAFLISLFLFIVACIIDYRRSTIKKKIKRKISETFNI